VAIKVSQGIKDIYLHKLMFNPTLVLEDGIVKIFLHQVGMWIVIHYFEE